MSGVEIEVSNFGNGEIVKFDGEYYMFKMSSYVRNPVVKPQDLGLVWEESGQKKIGAVFNGGAEICGDKIILAPRCHKEYHKSEFYDPKIGVKRTILENYVSEVYLLESDDGINFRRRDDIVIKGDGSDHSDFLYGIEDIRIIKTKERYFLIGCGKIKPPFKGDNADRVAVYSTTDLEKIDYHGIITSFDSRNAILAEHDKGFYMFLRFYPNVYLVKLDDIEVILNPGANGEYWKNVSDTKERYFFMGVGDFRHESEKIGPGTPLILTDEGWLFIYHAVGKIDREICDRYGLKEEIKRGYSVNVALLDYDRPEKIIARSKFPIYIPNRSYELYGDDEYSVDVPAVVFPVGAIKIENKLFVYAGSGDKYEILLTCDIDMLVDYLVRYYKR